MIGEGAFREDLYYRLSVFPIRLPPLRERREDIPVLARHFLDRFGLELGRRGTGLSGEALAALQQYHWPGNVRELRNVLERGLLVAEEDALRPQDLRFATLPAPTAPDAVLSLDELERRGIERALDVERGHVGRAALRLGVPRSSLYKKIKRYGMGATR
jgi:DNA-binding NtrC family response regulator